MFKRNKDNSLIAFGDRFRVQRSPRRLIAKATPELLSDAVTATHYAEHIPVMETAIDPVTKRRFSRPKLDGSGKPIMRPGVDARGEAIKIGREIEYLDWRGRKMHPAWIVYEAQVPRVVKMKQGPKQGERLSQDVWNPVQEFDSEDAALAAVMEAMGIPARAGLGPTMVYLSDDVLDSGLDVLDTLADRIDICSQEPANYTEATSTYTLGNEDHGAAGTAFGSPGDRSGGGREVVSTAVTSGSVTADGTASHFGVSDVANTALLAANSLASSQAVTNGNTFAIPSFAIGFPDPS